jgi:hypothetical protein
VTFSGSLVDTQPLSDFSICQALTDEVCHLPLSLRQSRNGGRARQRQSQEAADLADQCIDVTDIRKM